jgi:hypothetical protein
MLGSEGFEVVVGGEVGLATGDDLHGVDPSIVAKERRGCRF